MPRYYLLLAGGKQSFNDGDSMELPNLDAAVDEAVEAARIMVSDAACSGRSLELQRRFEIYGSEGKLLRIVPFRSVVQIH
jgi:hypothetical protein